MAPIPLSTFVYDRVPDPETSDVEAGAGAATSVGRDKEPQRSRRWQLAAAFGFGVIFSAACYGLWHLTGASSRVAAKEAVDAAGHAEHSTGSASTPSSSAVESIPSLNSTTKPFLIHFHGEPSINEREPITDCPLTVEYTKYEATAEGVVFNSDSHEGISQSERDKRREEQPWQKQVIWGSESAPNRASLEKYFRSIKEDGTSDLYDADMTCELLKGPRIPSPTHSPIPLADRLNGSVPGTYGYSYMDWSNPPVAYEDKRQDRIAAAYVDVHSTSRRCCCAVQFADYSSPGSYQTVTPRTPGTSFSTLCWSYYLDR